MRAAVVLFLGLVASATSANVRSGIVGGDEVEPHSLPYQVYLKQQGSYTCGGSVLDEHTILTASHCFMFDHNPNHWTVTAGDHDRSKQEGTEQVREVTKIIRHKNWSPLTNEDDIALMKLATPLKLNEYVAPIEQPPRNKEYTGTALVSGWGLLKETGFAPSEILMAVEVPIISDEECMEAYDGIGAVYPTNICAGEQGKDSCSGDSGGPLVCDGGVQCGIVSWGVGCARKQYPGVYTQTSKYIDWIHEHK